MKKNGQFGGLGSAIQSLFATGVTTSVLGSIFGKVKDGFMSVGKAGKNVFFK